MGNQSGGLVVWPTTPRVSRLTREVCLFCRLQGVGWQYMIVLDANPSDSTLLWSVYLALLSTFVSVCQDGGLSFLFTLCFIGGVRS